MDTTWKVISKYFTFGGAEDKKLYNNFVEIFSSEFGINLKQFIIESDQGSALKAVCDEFKGQIACLSHFLVSLKSTLFSFQAGQIIACRCAKDLDALLHQYANDLNKIKEEQAKKQPKEMPYLLACLFLLSLLVSLFLLYRY